MGGLSPLPTSPRGGFWRSGFHLRGDGKGGLPCIVNHLMVKKMSQLLFAHTDAGVADAHLHITVGFLCADTHFPTLVSKLAGIVSQRVQHEERQHTVGLHHGFGGLYDKTDALQLERHPATGHHVEQGLKRETLYAQVQLTLAQLNPMGQHVVLLVNLIGQLADIV